VVQTMITPFVSKKQRNTQSIRSSEFRPYRCGLIHKSNVSDHVKSRDSFLNYHLDGRKLFLY
jgi:hypothetical protein